MGIGHVNLQHEIWNVLLVYLVPVVVVLAIAAVAAWRRS